MTDSPKFTRGELERMVFGDPAVRPFAKRDAVAYYALTLLDEKEQAERERDEAYEAMLNLDPAVRRALERKGKGR